jgi:hypothetical protein
MCHKEQIVWRELEFRAGFVAWHYSNEGKLQAAVLAKEWKDTTKS